MTYASCDQPSGARPVTCERRPCSAQGRESVGPGCSRTGATPNPNAGVASSARIKGEKPIFIRHMVGPGRSARYMGPTRLVLDSTGGEYPQTSQGSAVAERGSLVRHGGARRAEDLHRRIIEEVRDPRRVQVRVVLNLLAEPGVLVSFFEHQAPIGIGPAFEARLQLGAFEEGGLERPAELLQVLLLALPARLEIGGQRTAAFHPPVQRVEQELVVVDHVVEAGAQVVELVEPQHVFGMRVDVLDLAL